MARRSQCIYVQIDIAGEMDRLWELTQTPSPHRRWDLRFTDITYLPRPDPNQPQHFRYETRIGFGLCIRGEGSTVGSHDAANGTRTSALKFWSDDPISLIREGSGYWKYIPSNNQTVRFLTVYDYTVRMGVLGRCFDQMIFRPLMGWATAWSFDRLRLWIERGIDPADSLRKWLINLLSRWTIAFVWIYQGLVPKLLFHHPDELAMLKAVGISRAIAAANCIGIIEIGLGLATLVIWRSRWLPILTIILMIIATVAVTITSPSYTLAAFNPVTLNVLLAIIAIIALLSDGNIPSARHCRRSASEPL